jgi:hypothetical protein
MPTGGERGSKNQVEKADSRNYLTRRFTMVDGGNGDVVRHEFTEKGEALNRAIEAEFRLRYKVELDWLFDTFGMAHGGMFSGLFIIALAHQNPYVLTPDEYASDKPSEGADLSIWGKEPIREAFEKAIRIGLLATDGESYWFASGVDLSIVNLRKESR